jgi:hypothetical protein
MQAIAARIQRCIDRLWRLRCMGLSPTYIRSRPRLKNDDMLLHCTTGFENQAHFVAREAAVSCWSTLCCAPIKSKKKASRYRDALKSSSHSEGRART